MRFIQKIKAKILYKRTMKHAEKILAEGMELYQKNGIRLREMEILLNEAKKVQ